MKNNKLRILVEGAVMVAMAFGLSLLTIYKLPWGGRITVLSMLPIVVFSIRNGVGSGLMCSFVYSLTQLAQGIIEDGLFTWGLTPLLLIGCIFFDYVGAFTVLGLAGMFRKKGMGGWISGAVIAIALRYVLHILSGGLIFVTVGMILDWDIQNAWVYSMVYNGAYMLPEMILTTVGAVVLFKTGAIKMILKGQDVKA